MDVKLMTKFFKNQYVNGYWTEHGEIGKPNLNNINFIEQQKFEYP